MCTGCNDTEVMSESNTQRRPWKGHCECQSHEPEECSPSGYEQGWGIESVQATQERKSNSCRYVLFCVARLISLLWKLIWTRAATPCRYKHYFPISWHRSAPSVSQANHFNSSYLIVTSYRTELPVTYTVQKHTETTLTKTWHKMLVCFLFFFPGSISSNFQRIWIKAWFRWVRTQQARKLCCCINCKSAVKSFFPLRGTSQEAKSVTQFTHCVWTRHCRLSVHGQLTQWLQLTARPRLIALALSTQCALPPNLKSAGSRN